MKQTILSLFALVAIAAGVNAQTTWNLDKVHSNVKFAVSHMVVSEVEGSFKIFDGNLVASKPDLSDAKINFSVDVASVNTDNERRDGHLKSDDFFNAEKFPKMTFVSKSMKPLGNNKYKLTGDLTKTVEFDVTYGGQINTGRGIKAGFKAKTTIDRLQYGLKYAPALEAGGLAVGKDVDITVLVELDQAK
jgi:polyisoprenoid-binding protein YceI